MKWVKGIYRKVKGLSLLKLSEFQSKMRATYSNRDWGTEKLKIIDLFVPSHSEEIVLWAKRSSKHTFDLLGSGKVKVHYGLDAKGFEGYKYPPLKIDFQFDDKGEWLARFINKANLPYSQKVWRFLRSINPSYEPIDWQLDFKSGYRWDNDTFYMDIRYGHKLGADVKLPWELSRFQHLSALAIAYKVTGDEKYALEYVSQILDWIATNPPMFGVNWKCTMDVAIRVANWLFWFGCIQDWVERQEWGDKFYKILLNSLYDHLKFIPENLEWSETLTTNHYLADIAGLLILASSTEDIFPVSKRLRKFALEELKKEMFKQVYPDGTDFEASTCYHRLALELFCYSVWWEVVHHGQFNRENYREIAEEIFGKKFVERLYKMFDAALYLLKPNGRMPQIGDNDNGQFIKLYPREVLDMRYLLALGAIFFKEPKFKVREFFQTEEDIAEVGILYSEKGLEIWNRLDWNELVNIKSKTFCNSGWYVMRDGLNYVIISCGPNRQNRAGGHAHNDKLSFELVINGLDIVVDPGTFVYTPLPEWRNKFRSTVYHNTLVIEGVEQNELTGIFTMKKATECRCLEFDWDNEKIWFEGENRGYQRKGGVVHRRRVVWDLEKKSLFVEDKVIGNGAPFIRGATREPSCLNIITAPTRSGQLVIRTGNIEISEGYYSLAYGQRRDARRILLKGLRYSIRLKTMNSTFDDLAETLIFIE